MYFPKFIKEKDTIGVCAPSAGIGRKEESFNRSLHYLKKCGYRIKETESVHVNNPRSASASKRGKEFNSLVLDKNVDMIMCAAGGDFLFEMLPYIDWKAFQDNPKWIMGASDPTSILYTITTKYDVATLYGLNAGSYDIEEDYPYILNNLAMLQGKKVVQKSFKKYQSPQHFTDEKLAFDAKVEWLDLNGPVDARGRCIGGCVDVLKDLFGTPLDGTKEFLDRYKSEGIIWYFDVFSFSAEKFYLTLLQMKMAGYFKNTQAVVVGRVVFPSSETGMTYEQALKKALGKMPIIHNADVGHTTPKMTLINGAMLHVQSKNGKGSLTFEMK